MSCYCLNPNCERPTNPDGAEFCQSCGTPLVFRRRFTVLRPLGEGGLGKTYLAQDRDNLNEPCVIKQLKTQAVGTQANKKIIELFLREAQQLKELRANPQIPDLLGYFEDGGFLYLVQQLVDGEDLEQELRSGVFSEEKIRSLLTDILPVLGFIHDRGVVHRDLKPANIMRRRTDGRLMLIDFGVSRQLSQGLTTVHGITVVGTPGYAPFEQMTEGSVNPGPPSDLYSLGVTCFQLLTGENPYPLSLAKGYSWVETWTQFLPTPMSEELIGVMDGMLKMRAAERFQSAAEVLTALNQRQVTESHQQRLAEYEQEFRRAVAAGYPLNEYVVDGLRRYQQQLGLLDADVEQVEGPIREQQERKAREAREQQVQQAQAQQERAQREQVEREAREKQAQQRDQEQLQAEQQRLREENQRRQADAQKTAPQAVNSTVAGVESPSGLSRRGLLALLGVGGFFGAIAYAGIKAAQESSTTSELPTNEVITVNSQGNIVSRRPLGEIETLREDIGKGVTLEMVLIPAGQFLMGSPSLEAGRDNDEGPQHEVTVPAFMMGKYEVTQAQWEAVMESNSSSFKGTDRPVESVSWNDAVAFCQKLTQQTGRTYRLPSEAEWEYACRGGTTTPFYFGPTLSPALANYNGSVTYGSGPKGESRGQTTEVGKFPPNAYGLYDMHGNVWEWCQDIYHANYQGAPSDGKAWVSENDNDSHVLRGGSWVFNPEYCRSADRFRLAPDFRYDSGGLRVVCGVART
jgi:eukaryotic-like serine/threonine-protein kinase